MKRRTFLGLSAAATIPAFLPGCSINLYPDVIYTSATEKSFATLEVRGDYYKIGYECGRYFGAEINKVCHGRKLWLDKMFNKLKTQDGREFSSKLFRSVEKHYPQYLEELHGLADGSGIAFDTIWTLNIGSELSVANFANPGCSTVYYVDKKNQWLFHNEDGNDVYSDKMFILKAILPDGMSFTALVYPGWLPGIAPGMNNHGIIHTANYIGTQKPNPNGTPRLFIGRAVLEARNFDDAIQIVTSNSRAFPWHHSIADVNTRRYASVETLPTGKFEIYEPKDLYTHTNHLIHDTVCNYPFKQADLDSASTKPRLNTLNTKISENKDTIDNPAVILDWLSSHEQSPNSPCVHPLEGDDGRTLATAYFDIKAGTMCILKGNPCEAVKAGRLTCYKFK